MSEQKKPWEQSWNQPAETSVSTQNKKPWEHKWNGNSEPEVEKSKGFGGHVRDIGASLAAGAASIPDVAIGIGDILTGGAVGKTVEDSGLYTPGSGREYWADKKTDQAKAQSQKFSDAEGIIDKTKVALTNPTLITNTVAESLPTMVTGGLVGRGLSTATKGAISPMVGGAIGEGTMMAGSQAENIRQQTDDGLLTGNQVAASVATGALGTLFGLAGGAVAKKFGFGDIDSMLAGANVQQVAGEIAKVPLKQVPKHVVLGALSEGLLEELPQSAQEQVLQNYALNKDLMDGVDDAIVMGALAGMTMGAAASGLSVQGHNQSYNAQEQLKVAQQAAQQAQESQAMRDTQSQLFGGGVPDPVLDPSKLSPFSDSAPLANPIIDMSRLEAADGNPRYDNGINFQAPNIETPLSLVEQQQTQADNGIDFERPEQGPTDLERQIQFNNTFGLETPDPVVDYNGISPFDNNPQKPIIDPQKVDLTPSQQMGLDPNLGPLSAAAATAVDSGISQQIQIEMQAQAAAETTSNVAGKTEDSNAPLQQAADAARELTPEQIHGKQNTYGADVTTAIEQLKQRQQGDQNAAITFDEGIQNGTIQQGNAPLNNGSQSVSEQHDTNAASAMGAAKGAAQKGLQPAKSDADQIVPSNQSLNEIQTSEAKSKLLDTQSKVAELEAQLVTEKSVPKKAQIRKQLEALSAERTAISENSEPATVQDLTDTQQIAAQQLSQVDSDIATVKQQLQAEKSVPKKMQMRKQLDSLQAQRTEIETQHKNIEQQTKIENAAHEAASSNLNDLPKPTQAQIEAGNYKKGHIKVHGLNIAVENPRGSERRGTDPDGKEWAHTMSDHYGYIKSSIGSDNEQIDTYIGRNPESEQVFIVDQIDQKTGGFDEHKVMMGFNSQEDAIQAYSSNFDKGWKIGPVRAMSKDEFKTWLKNGDTKKPAGESAAPQSETTLDPQSVQRDYGDSLESVMSDVETLGDDFTIDLHSVPKKRNALKNPNYHAVQHENGRVEILGMKHPATGEWVGKAPVQNKAPVQDSPAPAQAPVQEQIKDIKSNSPEKPDSSKPAATKPKEVIQDFGEKIGGARKDTAVKTGKKPVTEKPKDDRPTWAKRFEISEIAASSNPAEVGKWTISDTKNKDWMGNNRRLTNQIFNSQEEAEKFLPVAAVAMKHRVTTDTKDGKKGYIIVRTISDRKHVQVVQQLFDTRDAANEYLVRHAQEILETNTTFGELDLPRPENTQRTGVARREGDAKDSDFSRVFGFRGVEFGNWNNQAERQELLNDAFDGLMDLAEVLNIPPEALSLNGELALAFGARGQGLSSAKAHYESNRVVINLTKMNGAGSLAHEWWHAFDHYLSRQDGSASSVWIQHEDGSRSLNVKANPADRFASHGFKVVKSGVREDVRNNFEKLMVTMFKKSQAYIEDTQAADEFVARSRDEVQDKLNSIRENLTKQLDPQYYKRFNKPASADQLAEFDTAAELIITGQLLETEARKNPKSRSTFGGYRHTNDALDKINEIFKAVRGRSGFNADFKGVLDYLRGSMSRYMGRLKLLADAQQSTTKYKSVPTEFAMNAKELDQGRGSDYWTTPHEMSARAFQGYVEDKIAAKNARSPFLNYGPENVGILTPYGVKRPFPYGEERVAINQAFDDLIGGLQTEKTETGQRLYSRAQDNVQSGQTPEQVREALVERFGEKTISSLERRGLLDIISTVDEPGVEGFYQNGRVTLVANNLNETSIIPTFLHELGGHGGFQNIMSEEKYADLMGIFNDMVQRKHPLALEAKRLAERETDTKTQQLEYLPYLLTLASTQQEMNALQKSAIKRFIDKVVSAVKAWAFDRLGINLNLNENDLVALANRMVNQIGNQAQQNTDTNQNPLYSRQANAQQIIQNLVGNMNKQGRDKLKTEAGYKATHALQYVLGALGRRQLTELYQKLLPQLKPYNDMVAMMDADQNEVAALSDELARRWADLKDEKELANVMHDATLAKIDPAKPYQPGDNVAEYAKLKKQFDALSNDAKKVYREARDAYKKHHRDVRQAIQDRILRSSMSNQKKTELLQQMDANFFGYTQGVYFPLQRFGKYVVLVRDAKDQVISVSRAETLSEAHKLREILQGDYPNAKVHKPMLDKEYDAARDGVGRGFMTNLFNELGSFGLNAQRQAELEDILGQLYLKSLPDLSYAKHSVHRKGTAGFSQDARRAFAQNMFHGGSYLAKLRYKDQLEEMLDGMQKHATEQAKIDDDYEQPVAQQVIDEMNKRHKNMMEANSHPLSTALTSLGFLYYLGLSPASAAVNTLQTVLVAYPQMGAKWGYDKAGAALAKASDDFRKGVSIKGINPKNWENDIAKILKGDELKAYEEAVRRGVIDVTMAHDLAGIAQGEDSGVMWKLRPIMRVASTLFHNAERFNREVTFIAAYRLARDSGSMHEQAFEQAMDSTYKGHFDYSSGNRPRIMQGNIAKVILLFKQFGQNMIYTLARTAHQSLKGETPEARREAQRALAGIIGMHTVFAGVMGLPLVGPILAMASMLGSDDDEPWDAEAALRNALADALGTKTSEVLMKGASRFGPADLSGRVGINNLLLPDVQDGLEGKDFSDAMVMSALGPVVGILTNTFKGLAEIGQGHGMRGVETMSPVFLRSPLRSIRYATEGAQDKTGVMIKDDVGMFSLAAQAVGFSPSEVRLATEGRSAIYSHTKRLDKRRTELMNDYVRAVQRDDMDGQQEIWAEIQAFNQKNPSRRISRVQAMQSLRQREKRVKQAEHGIYLPNKKREDADIGRFAFDERL
ncbi:PLxRFG domain-containing protein [Acinetobacter lwoffii]|uniref:PLxRFG domain-containing protein n=1 Tax=Acinetobacter lwoffii TaxID=28090 RepID=UPI0021CDE3DF|nr:PLxRFG domain-containing protein [Acinetobacter lwoffii]MCU4438736.1 PLxRFG domain-containing protein [Acinetobacter lwoffii]